MVTEYGMSSMGAMHFAPLQENDDYGKSWTEPNRISDRLQEKVDAEINNFIGQGEKRATEILKKYSAELKAVSEKLLEEETLDGDQFEKLMGFKKARQSEED